MWNVFIQWISEHYPMLFCALAVVVLTAIVTWKAHDWVNRVKNLETEMPNKADKKMLPCATNEKNIEKHNDFVEQIRNDINDIKSCINDVQTYLISKNSDAAPIFSRKNSPRQLNELGKKVYEEIKGEEFLEENKELFISSIANRNPLTDLDVEEYALSVLIENTNKPLFNGLKTWVYNSPSIQIPTDKDGGTKEYTITMNDICFILSIPLRDMYIREKA